MTTEISPISAQVRTMQVIVAAMTMGVLTFGVVVLLVVQPQAPQRDPLLAYIGILMACAMIPAAWIVPEVIGKKLPATVGSYQAKLLVGLALLEGAAFVNLVAYLLEGRPFSLWMAALLAALLAMRFPTTTSVENWLERRERLAEEQAAFGNQQAD